MKVSSLPFLLVLVSSLLPAAGALANLNVYHAPAALALLGLGLAATFAHKPSCIARTWINGAILLFILILVIQILTGRGFVTLAAGGYVLAFLFVFHNLFLKGSGIAAGSIVRGLDFIYKYFIIWLVVEFVIVRMGMQPILHGIFLSSASPGYKLTNGADAARALGLLGNAGGLNSILLGSQIAGMLSLFATIWFWGMRNVAVDGAPRARSDLWILLSSLMFVTTVNGTVFMLLVLAFVIHGLFINKKYKIPLLILMIAALYGLSHLISAGYLFPRVFNENLVHLQLSDLDPRIASELEGLTTTGYYIFQFYTPIARFIALDWTDKLLGAGADYLRTTNDYLAGDFGFGASLLSAGMVWMSTFVVIVFATAFPALKVAETVSGERKVWSAIASLNGLIAILWLFSTLHYLQAFANPCGVMLFGLNLALAAYSRRRLRTR